MRITSAAVYAGRVAVALALLCALILAAGCQAPDAERAPAARKVQDPREAAREVAARFVATGGNISDYTGTMVISDIFQPYTPAGEKWPKVTRTMTVKVQHREPYLYRFLYYNPANELVVEELLNERDYVLNYSSENKVMREEVSDPRTLGVLSYDFQFIAREILREGGPVFSGTETLDGRQNYVYHAEFGEPRTYNNRLVRNTTLWIDADRLVLSRMELYNELGELHERIVYQDIRINTGLSPQEFAYTPPA